MSLDDFVKALINDGKYFLSEAKDDKDINIKMRYIRASITSFWGSLEGWLNCVSSDFVLLPENKLSLNERGFLLEKKLELSSKGEFKISNQDQYYSTEDKILFLLKRFGNYEVSKNSKMWSDFKKIKRLRDALIHPKSGIIDYKNISIKDAEMTMYSVIYLLKLLTKEIYKRNLRI